MSYEKPIVLGDDWGLMCPVCTKNNNLHHSDVEICNRQEDAYIGQRVLVSFQDGFGEGGVEQLPQVLIDDNVGNNPSPRRHGLRIKFSCETCPGIFWLLIYQHKGTTYLRWEQPWAMKPPLTGSAP